MNQSPIIPTLEGSASEAESQQAPRVAAPRTKVFASRGVGRKRRRRCSTPGNPCAASGDFTEFSEFGSRTPLLIPLSSSGTSGTCGVDETASRKTTWNCSRDIRAPVHGAAPAPLETLPDHLWSLIFTHLGVGDLSAVAQTCVFLHGVAHSPDVWRNATFTAFGRFFLDGSRALHADRSYSLDRPTDWRGVYFRLLALERIEGSRISCIHAQDDDDDDDEDAADRTDSGGESSDDEGRGGSGGGGRSSRVSRTTSNSIIALAPASDDPPAAAGGAHTVSCAVCERSLTSENGMYTCEPCGFRVFFASCQLCSRVPILSSTAVGCSRPGCSVWPLCEGDCSSFCPVCQKTFCPTCLPSGGAFPCSACSRTSFGAAEDMATSTGMLAPPNLSVMGKRKAGATFGGDAGDSSDSDTLVWDDSFSDVRVVSPRSTSDDMPVILEGDGFALALDDDPVDTAARDEISPPVDVFVVPDEERAEDERFLLGDSRPGSTTLQDDAELLDRLLVDSGEVGADTRM
jgi:F-box-like